jgi:uncharacterized protein YggE
MRDLSKTGELLQEALEAGANNVGGISFSVADPKALQQKARDQAIADAQAKAEQLAAGLGAQLGPLRQVSEYGGIVVPSAPVASERGTMKHENTPQQVEDSGVPNLFGLFSE